MHVGLSMCVFMSAATVNGVGSARCWQHGSVRYADYLISYVFTSPPK